MSEIEAIAIKQSKKPFSIIKEVCLVVKKHVALLLLSGLVFCAGFSVFYQLAPVEAFNRPIMEMCAKQADVDACESEHKKEIEAETEGLGATIFDNIGQLGFLFFLAMLFLSAAHYFMSVYYLRKECETAPAYSLDGFGQYVCKLFWKFLRPFLWNFIPIFGQIMYFRSLIRYEFVGYLTLMGCKDPLKESWKITEGNVWRLLGAQSLFGLVAEWTMALFILALVPLLILGAKFSFLYVSPPMMAIAWNGLSFGVGSMLSIFVSYAGFSVLCDEFKTKVE